ncbi:uncharacterized protein LOC142181684 [Nicotiana tabacum]|uniref:Uncharacterized protein LOC142181684 n=1 Tax=Nicotiana tabacum TaxID=4097 RepID=A0AC58UNW7_TOBAC
MRLISLQLVLHPPILASYSDFSFLGEKAGGIALQQNIRTSIVTTSVPICLTLKMIIYPDGDGSEDGCDHIFVYLAIAETSSLQAGWEVNATFSFLIFDQIHDKYLVMRGMEQRFHNIKTEWGFPNCISHDTFREPSKGYLVNGKCVFGVDVYVIKNRGVDVFGRRELKLYPTGDSSQNGRSISIFLESVDAKGFDFRKRVQAKFSISVKDQITGAHHKKTSTSSWFTAASYTLGWPAFMRRSELKDPKKGFLVGNCCFV